MRWSILGGPFPSGYSYLSYGVIFVLFILSIFYFRNAERHMADIL
jgi:ABC-type polysaccharide/polyol phosphate export permease